MQNNDNTSKIQSYEFTGESLAESLSLEWGTLYKKMIRMGYNYGKDDLIPAGVVQDVVAEFAQPHPRRSEEVVESAQQVAQMFNIQINISPQPALKKSTPVVVENQPPITPEGKAQSGPPALKEKQETSPPRLPAGPRRASGLGKQEMEPPPLKENRSSFVTVLAYLAFIFILLFQMEHVAHIGMQVSAFRQESAREVSGWLFAFTFNLTALIMTLRRGVSAEIRIGKWSMSYLLAFAIMDVIFFVMASAPFKDGPWLAWSKAVLVGGATAFVIYSFNELLTERQ